MQQNLDYLFDDSVNSIKHNLEELLNTRRRCVGFDNNLTELNRSLINYGGGGFFDKTICHHIEQTICCCDSRFKQVKVVLQDDNCGADNVLFLHIEAILYAEPIIFSSRLDKSSGEVCIVAVG